MEKIDKAIAAKEVEVKALKEKIEALENQLATNRGLYDRAAIELEAFKQAARLMRSTGERQAAKASPTRKPSSKRKGRQSGDISHEWRQVLRAMRKINRPLGYEGIAKVAESQGIKTKMPNVRERVRTMAENDLLIGGPKRGYLVTDRALERFGFMNEFLKKNEAVAE